MWYPWACPAWVCSSESHWAKSRQRTWQTSGDARNELYFKRRDLALGGSHLSGQAPRRRFNSPSSRQGLP